MQQGKQAKWKKGLPNAPSIAPNASHRRTWSTIPSETGLLVEAGWLTDKVILCWLNQELYHLEIDEPRTWTPVVSCNNALYKWMHDVEFGSTPDNMVCRSPTFLVNRDDKRDCIGLFVARIVESSWTSSYLGFGNP